MHIDGVQDKNAKKLGWNCASENTYIPVEIMKVPAFHIHLQERSLLIHRLLSFPSVTVIPFGAQLFCNFAASALS